MHGCDYNVILQLINTHIIYCIYSRTVWYIVIVIVFSVLKLHFVLGCVCCPQVVMERARLVDIVAYVCRGASIITR